MTPSPDNKTVAVTLRDAFGGNAKVRRCTHNSLPLHVDILIASDSIDTGISSFGSIGLSDHPMRYSDGSAFPHRLELLSFSRADPIVFAEFLAAICFGIIRDGKVAGTGDVFPNYVREFFPTSTVPHAFLAAPFAWEGLTPLHLPTKRVFWAMVVPISESENRIRDQQGPEELETLLERHGPDVSDLMRPSTV